MSQTQVQVGPDLKTAIGGSGNEMLVSQFRSAYGDKTSKGKMFHGCSVVGGNAFPIYSATALVFALWNKSTEVDLELVHFSAGYVSGTGVAGPFGYQWKDVGTAVGVPLAAFNPVAPINGRLGYGDASKAGFTNAATNTIVAAPTANFIPGNLSQLVTTAADATNVPFIMEQWFHGSIIIPPGVIFFPAALLASVDLFAMKLSWLEVPRPTQS